MVATLADPTVRAKLAKLDLETPEALGGFHDAQFEKWWPIIRAANIAPQ